MSDCGNVKKVFVSVKEAVQQKIEPVQYGNIHITENAAEKIISFCKKDNKSPQEYGLHVKVVKDGCSGNSYIMEIASIEAARERKDKLFCYGEATLIIDKASYFFVMGSELTYVETLLMSGFQLKNPNIKKSCSCGSSFSVK